MSNDYTQQAIRFAEDQIHCKRQRLKQLEGVGTDDKLQEKISLQVDIAYLQNRIAKLTKCLTP